MMKRVVLLFFSLCLYVTSLAQFSDSVHYFLKYGSTGSINKTNDGTAYLLNNNLGFKISKKRITLNAGASYIYGKQNHEQTNNDVSAALDFSVNNGSDRFYYWGLTTYDRSYSLKINDRLQAGAGIAYDVIKRENAVLNFSEGILFETSNLYLHDTVPDVYQTLRNSFRLSYKWVIKKIIVFEGANYFQNSFMNGDDYIIKCNNSLSVKLRSWLSITAALTYNKLNRTERENLLVNYGLAIEKFF